MSEKWEPVVTPPQSTLPLTDKWGYGICKGVVVYKMSRQCDSKEDALQRATIAADLANSLARKEV